ncbi:MAG TPA: hypothetical protein VF025_00320 [Gaiellaceae bacterium]
MNRFTLFGAAFAAALATAGLVTQFGLGGGGKVQIGDGSVSALGRAARTGDVLPRSILAYPFAERNFASPDGRGSRVLSVHGSLTLYAVPGKAGMVCLIEADSLAETAGGACADRSVLKTGTIYMADRQEDGSLQVAGLVGDGHTFAEANGRRTPVENNSFLLAQVEGTDLSIGSTTETQQIDLGG